MDSGRKVSIGMGEPWKGSIYLHWLSRCHFGGVDGLVVLEYNNVGLPGHWTDEVEVNGFLSKA